jgi:tetratricopeptide (TPR) repeat protein
MCKKEFSRGGAILVTVLLILFLTQTVFAFQKPEVWGALEPGQYAIGFKTLEKYDYSRSFQPKYDYFGKPLEGERARPIQISIWYPARESADAIAMTYGEYSFAYPEDESFFDVLSNLQNREIGYLNNATRDQGLVLNMMSMVMAGVRNASPAEGQFPLIVYHPDLNGSYCDNAVMCEFLASHGYVVMTTHSIGISQLLGEENPIDLEMMIRDKEFALAELRDAANIDHNKLAVFGLSHGGLAALLMRMHSTDVDAVVSLDGWFNFADHQEFTKRCTSFSIEKMSVPLLHIHGEMGGERNQAVFNDLAYSDRQELSFYEFSTQSFSHYVLFSILGNEDFAAMSEEQRMGYKAVCDYVLNFYNAHLKGDESGLAFLSRSPSDNGYDPELFASSYMAGKDQPPTRNQFINIAQEKGGIFAYELYNKFMPMYHDLVLFDENTFNRIGYGFLQGGRTDEAVAIFKMNADAFPKSSNTWDSLAESLMAAGKREEALQCWKKALEVLPDDTSTPQQLKDMIRQNCEAQLSNSEG